MPLLDFELHHLGLLHRASVYPSSVIGSLHRASCISNLYASIATRWRHLAHIRLRRGLLPPKRTFCLRRGPFASEEDFCLRRGLLSHRSWLVNALSLSWLGSEKLFFSRRSQDSNLRSSPLLSFKQFGRTL